VIEAEELQMSILHVSKHRRVPRAGCAGQGKDPPMPWMLSDWMPDWMLGWMPDWMLGWMP